MSKLTNLQDLDDILQAHYVRLSLLLDPNGTAFGSSNPVPTYAAQAAGIIEPGLDPFFRRRVSNPHTLADHKQIYNDTNISGTNAEHYPLWWDNIELSGADTTSVYNYQRASTTLGVANLTAGVRVRATRQRPNYQPGKGMLLIVTGVVGPSATGIEKHWGLFDEDNGLFFYQDADGLGIGHRSSVSGSPVDTLTAQADWSINPLLDPALGPVLDPEQALIWFIDFEWLGVGTVAYGVVIDRTPYYVHFDHHSNLLNSVYMSTPNLPVTWRIENDGTGPASTVEQICTTVISEGGVQPLGSNRGRDMGSSFVTLPSSGATYAACGIRLRSGYIGAQVNLQRITALGGANDTFVVSLHFNPTLATDLVWSDLPDSAVQFGTVVGADPPNNQVTLSDPGHVMFADYVSSQIRISSPTVESALRLGANYQKTEVDEIIVCMKPVGTGITGLASMNWQEVW